MVKNTSRRASTESTESPAAIVGTPDTDHTLIVHGPGYVEYGGHRVTYDRISPKGLAYVMQYGFAKSLQDSIAGLATEVKANPKDFAAEFNGIEGDDLVGAVTAARMSKRLAAIMAGDIGARIGVARLSGVDKIMRDIGRERLKAASVATGKKLPTGEALTALVEKLVAKNHDAIKTEAEARLDAMKAAGEGIDIDELMTA